MQLGKGLSMLQSLSRPPRGPSTRKTILLSWDSNLVRAALVGRNPAEKCELIQFLNLGEHLPTKPTKMKRTSAIFPRTVLHETSP